MGLSDCITPEVREGSSRDLWKNWLSPHCVAGAELEMMGCKGRL